MADEDYEGDLYRCTLCDSKVEDRGRYGHVKFTDGDGHGPKGDVPENPEDYFVKADSELEDNENDDDPEGNGQSSGESSVPNEPGNSSGGTVETGDETGSRDSPLARLKAFLFSEV